MCTKICEAWTKFNNMFLSSRKPKIPRGHTNIIVHLFALYYKRYKKFCPDTSFSCKPNNERKDKQMDRRTEGRSDQQICSSRFFLGNALKIYKIRLSFYFLYINFCQCVWLWHANFAILNWAASHDWIDCNFASM